MAWDEEAARAKAREVEPYLRKWESDFPEASRALVALWKDAYMICGHKRLARMLLGGRSNSGKGGD